ncbi:MAG: endonuclease domain-containing protein [Alphaproteobacteria bacterium]|nr:endonuclease domain-containing protein [Alphaproteobacteria bacterium]
MRLFNRSTLLARRRELRNALTPAEVRLWSQLKGGQLCGRKFRRQHSIGPYVLDFYCPDESLAIELDGDSHDTEAAMAHDVARDAYVMKHGIRTLRFRNQDVLHDIDNVLMAIEGKFRR